MGEGSLFDQFDESARRALVCAGLEARALNHALIDTEHLLLALASEASSVPSRALTLHGLSPERARGRLLTLLEPHPEPATGPFGFALRLRELLEIALFSRPPVSDHALLLALAVHDVGPAGRVLLEAGISTRTLATCVERAICDAAVFERRAGQIWSRRSGPLYLL